MASPVLETTHRPTPPRPVAAPRRPFRWAVVVPPLLAAAAFAPALNNGFINFDDYLNLRDNPHFRGLGWAQVRWAASTFHLGVYQPRGW